MFPNINRRETQKNNYTRKQNKNCVADKRKKKKVLFPKNITKVIISCFAFDGQFRNQIPRAAAERVNGLLVLCRYFVCSLSPKVV